LPTKKILPEEIPPGYENDLSFTEQQVAALAEILDLSVGIATQPMQNAGRAIGMLGYTEPPSESEISTGLSDAAQRADQLRAILTELGPASKRAVFSEYGKTAAWPNRR
jgi:hypothetical protein